MDNSFDALLSAANMKSKRRTHFKSYIPATTDSDEESEKILKLASIILFYNLNSIPPFLIIFLVPDY